MPPSPWGASTRSPPRDASPDPAAPSAGRARESLADARDEEAGPYVLSVGGRDVALEHLEDALDQRVERMMRTIRELRRGL